MNNQENSFVAYEYTTVNVKGSMASLYSDCYKNFGWTADGGGTYTAFGTAIKFKRDRRIKNRAEVCELQRRCENALTAIEKLEASRNSRATSVSMAVGLVGTAFMAGSVFAVLAQNIALCVILAIPAFAGWGLGYLLYGRVKKSRAAYIAPQIDKQYEIIYEACEKASKLLA